jgi:steroid delta-isomerase-like uncharacterized protein
MRRIAMAVNSKEISRRVFEEVWNNKKLNAVDELMEANYIHHDVQSPVPKGIDGYKQFVSYYLNAFPDLQFTIDDEIADEQTAVSRWTVTGTHQGDLPGIPRTGRRISVTGITIARVRNGKVIESWNNWDALGLMQQLGVVPVEARSRAA